MEEEDGASNSSTSTESLASCNALNWPYFNAPSVFEGTSNHSTGTSDESLEREERIRLGELIQYMSDNDSADELEAPELGPEELAAWMSLLSLIHI